MNPISLATPRRDKVHNGIAANRESAAGNACFRFLSFGYSEFSVLKTNAVLQRLNLQCTKGSTRHEQT